ncbi:UDP-glycosyltransferase 83A1 [Arachis duranensis]|uniref:UDP-glycosyltransferase 83A1 n=1 Tax=Arachis duranensis TaxID=130453 RepID=A0A9C6TCT0_ARADU|nr:UDP-glycosyltransferase 83A1 [Arachis duranensis]
MKTPTVLALPWPAQGHVNPLMTFSQKLADHGCNIIFVNTEFIHEKVVSSINGSSSIKLMSIPDGLEPEDDRRNIGELCLSMLRTMPSMLEKLIEDLRLNDGITISCIVYDGTMGWALEVAKKMGINGALFWPASAALFAMQYNIPKLMDDGTIDSSGAPSAERRFQLSPSIREMDTGLIWWTNFPKIETQRKMFKYLLSFTKTQYSTDWYFCNTTNELEHAALSCFPKLLPIGPLLKSNNNEDSTTSFLEEDLSCMSWLDNHSTASVLYVAFGSTTHFNEKQFVELALGLDLTNKPFLLVMRQDFKYEFKAGSRGKIVRWAPQQKVLSHPAIACFVTHCGWNSTIESLSNGVPFLCWPYFCDQFLNKLYICDDLKVGLGFEGDENGLISHEEIKAKVDQLLGDENIKSRSLELKKKLKSNNEKGGASRENLRKFVAWLKKEEQTMS